MEKDTLNNIFMVALAGFLIFASVTYLFFTLATPDDLILYPFVIVISIICFIRFLFPFDKYWLDEWFNDRKIKKERKNFKEFSDSMIYDEIAHIKNLISEKESKIEKIELETRLKEQNLKQEVQKEHDPKIIEIEPSLTLTRNYDEDTLKYYKSQLKNLQDEMSVRLKREQRKDSEQKIFVSQDLFEKKLKPADFYIDDEIAKIWNLIGEKKQEIEKIEREAQLKEQNLEQEVQKEYKPKISELESCLAKSYDKDAIKSYNSQLKNLHMEMSVRLRTELKNITEDKISTIKSNIREIENLNRKLNSMGKQIHYLTSEKDLKTVDLSPNLATRDEKDIEIEKIEGLHELALQTYYAKNFDKSIETYEKLLAINDKDVNALVGLGLSYVGKNIYGKAIELYWRALELEPNEPLTWDSMGLAHELNGQKIEAEKAYQKAHELAPDDPEIMGHLKSIQDK